MKGHDAFVLYDGINLQTIANLIVDMVMSANETTNKLKVINREGVEVKSWSEILSIATTMHIFGKEDEIELMRIQVVPVVDGKLDFLKATDLTKIIDELPHRNSVSLQGVEEASEPELPDDTKNTIDLLMDNMRKKNESRVRQKQREYKWGHHTHEPQKYSSNIGKIIEEKFYN